MDAAPVLVQAGPRRGAGWAAATTICHCCGESDGGWCVPEHAAEEAGTPVLFQATSCWACRENLLVATVHRGARAPPPGAKPSPSPVLPAGAPKQVPEPCNTHAAGQ